MRYISLFCLLFLFWLVLSGHYETHLIVIGLLCCALCVYVAARMKVIDEEGHPVHLFLRAPIYFSWLAKEIVMSALGVTAIILRPKLLISPTMVDVKASQRTTSGINIYGHSITLTPGTITVQAIGDRLKVHALTKSGADDLEEGGMDRWVTYFEGEK